MEALTLNAWGNDNKPKRCINFIKDITPTLPSPEGVKKLGWGWGVNAKLKNREL